MREETGSRVSRRSRRRSEGDDEERGRERWGDGDGRREDEWKYVEWNVQWSLTGRRGSHIRRGEAFVPVAGGCWVLRPVPRSLTSPVGTVQYVRALGTVYGYQLRARYTINPSTPYKYTTQGIVFPILHSLQPQLPTAQVGSKRRRSGG
jgi:hypothetical protein